MQGMDMWDLDKDRKQGGVQTTTEQIWGLTYELSLWSHTNNLFLDRQNVSPLQEMLCRSAGLLFDQDPKLCEDFDWRLASRGSGMTKESGFANSGSCSETTLATTCVAVSSDSGLWFNQVSETPLTTGCTALFMSWIWQNGWTQVNAICSVKSSWHSCYRGRSYHSCDYGNYDIQGVLICTYIQIGTGRIDHFLLVSSCPNPTRIDVTWHCFQKQ